MCASPAQRRSWGQSFGRAFTLVECMVCIAGIALLLAMLLPAVSKVRESARVATCASNLRQIGLAMQSYAKDADGYLPVQQFDTGYWNWQNGAYAQWHTPSDWLQSPGIDRTATTALVTTYGADPRLFLCPANGEDGDRIRMSYTAAGGTRTAVPANYQYYGWVYTPTSPPFANPRAPWQVRRITDSHHGPLEVDRPATSANKHTISRITVEDMSDMPLMSDLTTTYYYGGTNSIVYTSVNHPASKSGMRFGDTIRDGGVVANTLRTDGSVRTRPVASSDDWFYSHDGGWSPTWVFRWYR